MKINVTMSLCLQSDKIFKIFVDFMIIIAYNIFVTDVTI